jgi:hypothetical protein
MRLYALRIDDKMIDDGLRRVTPSCACAVCLQTVMMKALGSDSFHEQSHNVHFKRLVYAVVLALGYFSWSIYNDWTNYAGHGFSTSANCASNAPTEFDWYAVRMPTPIVF